MQSYQKISRGNFSHRFEHSSEEILHKATNRSEGDAWSKTHHFELKLWVRNKLRERFAREDVTLEQAWAWLIDEAARRYVEGGAFGAEVMRLSTSALSPSCDDFCHLRLGFFLGESYA
jgi:hypothetical protein